MTKPISPDEVKKETVIPDYVIEAFNYLIQLNWNGHSSTIYLEDVVSKIGKTDPKHLDVESIYRNQGWKVKYDQPAYCENFKAYYVFSKDK